MAQNGGSPLEINGVLIFPNSYVLDADLSGLDLSWIDFSNIIFSNSNLGSANLSEANFTATNLKDDVIRNTDISRGLLIDVKLGGADLSDGCLGRDVNLICLIEINYSC